MKYITTPIYYVNGKPHIGSSYTSIAADILSRFWRMHEHDVFFLTGTDEHGMKVAQSAEKQGKSPQEFCDVMSAEFRKLSTIWNLSNTDFIRTTEERHKKAAQEFWNAIAHDIYKSTYKGWYDSVDECFVAEADVCNEKTKDGHTVSWMEEDCYFFALSKYKDRLLEYYRSNSQFIAPEKRMREVESIVKQGLNDLCISRSRFSWGIPVPNDEKHVMYVWIDALTNYLTALGYPKNNDVPEQFQTCVHLVGKEILKFHAVYWPALLMSAGLPLPKRIFAHGWLTSEGIKMSKSLGNVIYPEEITKLYHPDVIRYYLFREIRFGEDGDFSKQAVEKRLNYDLRNDFGNLVQRVISLAKKFEGFSPTYDQQEKNNNLIAKARSLPNELIKYFEMQDISGALDAIWQLVTESNRFVEETKPWALLKNNDTIAFCATITALLEATRSISMCLKPFMPTICSQACEFLRAKGELFQELQEPLSSQVLPDHFPLFPKDDK